MRLAYSELHNIAVHHFRQELLVQSLQPTDILNEACVRLLTDGTMYKNRRYFFGAASQAMHRILVENARRRGARKRGGGFRRVDFSEAERIGFEQPSELLDFHTALRRLGKVNPRWAETAELRVFGEWSTPEVAVILGIGQSTARRRWQKAREWIRDTIARSTECPEAGEEIDHPITGAQ